MTKKEVFETILKSHEFAPTKIETYKPDFGTGWIIEANWKGDKEHEGIEIVATSFDEAMFDLLKLLNKIAEEIKVVMLQHYTQQKYKMAFYIML